MELFLNFKMMVFLLFDVIYTHHETKKFKKVVFFTFFVVVFLHSMQIQIQYIYYSFMLFRIIWSHIFFFFKSRGISYRQVM